MVKKDEEDSRNYLRGWAIPRNRRHNAPLERHFWHFKSPVDSMIGHRAASGVALLLATALALIAMNSPFSGAYISFIETPISLTIGEWSLTESLKLWVNDGLMGLFLLAVGLEIKKELLVGELSTFKKAVLPFIAAFGGIVTPAIFYLAMNPGAPEMLGWGIPMATDIAFVIGIMALLGDRVPRSLYIFLITLAIVDDLAAVLIIAFFYTSHIDTGYLLQSGLLFALLVIFNNVGIRKSLPYYVVGSILWFAMLKSGVHASIAGVLVAMAIPIKQKIHPSLLGETVFRVMQNCDASLSEGGKMTFDQHHAIIRIMKRGAYLLEAPSHRMIEGLRVPAAFIVVPIFAFVNAGIPIEASLFMDEIFHPVALGVAVGLVFGKFIGVSLSSLFAVKMGWTALPTGMTRTHLLGVAMLAGIGFTMSMFLGSLGFRLEPELQRIAKLGTFTGSLIAGSMGLIFLYLASSKKEG